MQVIMYQANAFTNELFEGSPIGIVPDARRLTEENMKRIVKLTNLDKIAFITDKVEENCFNLKFFNSEEEIVFCDSATVASFYALADKGYIKGIEEGVVRVYQCTTGRKMPIDIYFKDWGVDRVELCEQKPISLDQKIDIDGLSRLLNLDREDIGSLNHNVRPEIMIKSIKEMIIPVKTSDALDRVVVDLEKIRASAIMKDIDKLYIFSIDEQEVINYICFESILSESCENEDTNSGLIYYIKKNKLLTKDHFIYKDKSFKSKQSYMHCEILENKDGYPIKIGGKASIYLEGVVTYG